MGYLSTAAQDWIINAKRGVAGTGVGVSDTAIDSSSCVLQGIVIGRGSVPKRLIDLVAEAGRAINLAIPCFRGAVALPSSWLSLTKG